MNWSSLTTHLSASCSLTYESAGLLYFGASDSCVWWKISTPYSRISVTHQLSKQHFIQHCNYSSIEAGLQSRHSLYNDTSYKIRAWQCKLRSITHFPYKLDDSICILSFRRGSSRISNRRYLCGLRNLRTLLGHMIRCLSTPYTRNNRSYSMRLRTLRISHRVITIYPREIRYPRLSHVVPHEKHCIS